MLGVISALAFAILMGIASIFARRGLENGSFYALLVISLTISSPLFLFFTAMTTGFIDNPLAGVMYAAAGAIAGSIVARSLYFIGINYLGPGKSLSITATSPLYAAVLAWTVLDETITSLVVAGTLTIVMGIVLVSKDIRTQTERAEYSILVALYPVMGAVFAAIAVVFRKLALTTGIAPIEAATVNMVVGFLVVAPPLATRRCRQLVDVDRSTFWNFVAASVLMGVGFIFYFLGLQVIDASIFFPLVQTQPLFAVMLSSVFLRRLEIVTRWTALGSVVIVAGATLVVVG